MMEKTAMTRARNTASSGVVDRGAPQVSAWNFKGLNNLYPSAWLTIHKLNGKNHLKWARSIKLAIDGKEKLGHLIREITKLAAHDPTIRTWRFKNSIVIVWLVNSMELTIGKMYLFLPMLKEVGEAACKA